MCLGSAQRFEGKAVDVVESQTPHFHLEMKTGRLDYSVLVEQQHTRRQLIHPQSGFLEAASIGQILFIPSFPLTQDHAPPQRPNKDTRRIL